MPLISADFIWDDDIFVIQNPLIQSPKGILDCWISLDSPDYLPITISSLWIEWRLWGKNARGYHITNIFFHFLYCIGIACIFKKLNWPGGWIAAILFAIHPVNVETVAWITQRKNILCFFFTIFCIYFFVQELNHQRYHIKSLTLFICALLSKAASIMLPFWLLILICCQFKRDLQKKVLRILPFFFSSFIFALITIYFQYTNAMGNISVRTDSMLERFFFSFQAFIFYLYKAVFPASLCFVYPISPDRKIMLTGFFVFILFITILYKYRHRKWGKASILSFSFYVLNLIPVLGFFDIYFMRFSYVSDHWQSLSLMGFTSIIAAFLGQNIDKSNSKKYIAYTITFFLIVILTIKTNNQCRQYLTETDLWEKTLKCNPCSILPHDRMALISIAKNKYDKAEKHLKKSISIDSSNWEAFMNLGNLYKKMDKNLEAEKMYLKALAINPGRPAIYVNLGNLKLKTNQYVQAINYYQKALQKNPKSTYLHFQLGLINMQGNNTEKALMHFQKVLSVKPNHARAHYNTACILSRSNSFQAIRHLKKCISMNKLVPESNYKLGEIYAFLCRCEDAKMYYKKAGLEIKDSIKNKGKCCNFSILNMPRKK